MRYIILILLDLLLWGCGKKSDQDLEPQYVVIKGKSMEPLLTEGQVVLMVPIPFDDVVVGDIVGWRGMQFDVLHRVIARTEKCLFTQGDNEQKGDGVCIRRGDYLGLVRL